MLNSKDAAEHGKIAQSDRIVDELIMILMTESEE